jgi:hypothetical protein
MRAILLGVLLLCGCALDVALYRDDARSVVAFKGDGLGSFCFAGLDVGSIVVIPAFGWGELSCGDVISPTGEGGEEEATD